MSLQKNGRAKRANGFGTVHKLKSGKWRWQSSPIGPEGKRISKTFLTEEEAELERARGIVKKEEGLLRAPSNRTVYEQLERWWQFNDRGWARNTAANYRRAIRLHLKPVIGHLKVQDLTSEDVADAYLAIIQSPRSQGRPRTVLRTAKTALVGALDMAVQSNLLNRNPAQGIKMKAQRDNDDKVTAFWNVDQAQHFLRCVPDTAWGRVFEFALLTGLRRGEVLGLRWKNVCLEGDSPHFEVVDNYTKVDGINMLTTLKNKSQRRSLGVGGRALALLQKCWILRNANDHVFPSEVATPLSPDNADRALKAICKTLELPVIPPHGLRHTYVSVQRSRGISLERISRQLGHASPTITLAIYSHIFTQKHEDLTLDILDDTTVDTE